MVKLICVSFSVLMLAVTAVAGAQSSAQAAGGATPSTNPCQIARLQCKADCGDLNGGALGSCLRACDVEYKECLSGHPSLTDSEPTANSSSALVATQADCQPEAAGPLGLSCFEKLELCGESCGNDVACNRSCVKAYHTCLGH
jgi:hypothetical protein